MGLIRSYGLFWREQDVFWGRQKAKGILLGKDAKAKRDDAVDFREQVGIYVLYANYRIIYVGQAGYGNAKLFSRLKSHRKDHLAGRWDRFSWFGTKSALLNGTLSTDVEAKKANLSDVLNHLEGILISAAEPPLNRQHSKWGPNAKKYLQVRGPSLGPAPEKMIQEMYSRQILQM